MPTGQPKGPVTETLEKPIASDLPETSDVDVKEAKIEAKALFELEKPDLDTLRQLWDKLDLTDKETKRWIREKFSYKDTGTFHFLRWEKGLSNCDMGKLFGVDDCTISFWGKKHKIESRTLIEAFALARPELGVIKVGEKRDFKGLFKVRDFENPVKLYDVDLNTETCTCDIFKGQGIKCEHIGLAKEEVERRQEHDRERFKNRYHSDPEVRRRKLEATQRFSRKRYLIYREAYEGLKLVLGGKCEICGEDRLDFLDPHHPDGREEKGISFVNTKEFRDWVTKGKVPNVKIICVGCHRNLRRKYKINLTSNKAE